MNEQIQHLYDKAAARHEGGAKSAAIKEEILPDVIDLLEGIDRDLAAEARAAINATVDPERKRRRRTLRDQMEYVLDAIDEDGAYVDPLLDLAFPLGTEGGEDKLLRHWTTDDIRTVILMAYRKAGEATQAAVKLDQTGTALEGTMAGRGAHEIGDMFGPSA